MDARSEASATVVGDLREKWIRRRGGFSNGGGVVSAAFCYGGVVVSSVETERG
jgi:hypothetical protein